MVKIVKVIAVPGMGGFYNDDEEAIREGAPQVGFVYWGDPVTPGFKRIRQPSESLSIGFVLDTGEVAWGDAVSVQYSGVSGREPLFVAEEGARIVKEVVAPQIEGMEVTSFKDLASFLDSMEVDGKKLHTALRYGLTQAALMATSLAKKKTMAEVIAEEYGISPSWKPVPILAQSGDDRYTNAEKMILKKVDVLPHGLFNSVEKIGRFGEKLMEYSDWLRKRIRWIGGPDYRPVIHFDVYGTIGLIFDKKIHKIADYLMQLEETVRPYKLRVEEPIDMGSKEAQIEGMRKLRFLLKAMGSEVEIVVDEWCNTLEDAVEFVKAEAADIIQLKMPDLGGINNTIEAAKFIKERGFQAYLGGSCNETDLSARISVHVALAVEPIQMLAKPGMGVDEAIMIVRNEMKRALAFIKARKDKEIEAPEM